MDEYEIPWWKKTAKAKFRGALTGRHKDENGNRLDRYKLLWDSLDYPDHLEVNYTRGNGAFEDDDIP